MKYLDKNLDKMNNLLYLNYEVKQIYLELFQRSEDETLEIFFKEIDTLRSEFIKVLKKQIIEFAGKPITFDKISKRFNRVLVNPNRWFDINDPEKVIVKVHDIEKTSVAACNNLLQEHHLPVSVCKTLIGFIDKVQGILNTMRTKQV